ncbi:hypothetical protein H2O10_08170 [Acinetobacter nosocomialis]|nr:hypothetical protein [Acinetobacter nosocomialis]MBO8225361.1 hypothetical protein [Acinetobacter nosocomialis]MBO8249330.1 hypothetical protein [Acinetobacter nosocomialis]
MSGEDINYLHFKNSIVRFKKEQAFGVIQTVWI